MKIKYLILITFLVVLLVNFTGCNKLENLTKSSSKLILWSIIGLSAEGDATTVVLSDVLIEGSVFEDIGTASFTAVLLDPAPSEDRGVGFYEHVIIDQVDITYSRSDMSNAVPGKDIPFSFTGKVHFVVTTGELNPASLSFTLVQHVAKLESPLVELSNLGQEHVLKLEATITFHAKDMAGRRLEPAIGTISIWFSNFSDPLSGGGEGSGTGGGES